MSNIIHKAFLLSSRTPLTQFQRYRGKINIQRPKAPHYQRAVVLAVTQPHLPKEPKTVNCFKSVREKQEENPYMDIIAREVRNWFEHSRMVGIYHLNSISSDDIFNVRVDLHKHNMYLKTYGRKIMAKALKNTKYETLLPLFNTPYCLVFSSEDRTAKLMHTLRKVPQMVLLGGIVYDKLLSRNELIEYGKLPSLQYAQSELVQTLNMAGSNVVQQLEAHQNNLVNILDVYAKDETKAETKTVDNITEENKE